MEVPGLEEVSSPAVRYYRGGSLGPPLVLLNALGQGLPPWTPLVERLLPRRVLLWEMETAASHTFDRHARDLEAVAAHEALGARHLVGWCTGPKVALAHYRRRPEAVLSMVFLSPSFKHASRPEAFDTPYERDLEVLCRAVDRRPETAPRLRQLVGTGAWKPFSTDAGLVAYAREHLDFWRRDPFEGAGDVRVPTLFVGAERDEIVSPAGVQLAAERFPGARYVELAGATHFALNERPDVVAELVEDFVRPLDRAA